MPSLLILVTPLVACGERPQRAQAPGESLKEQPAPTRGAADEEASDESTADEAADRTPAPEHGAPGDAARDADRTPAPEHGAPGDAARDADRVYTVAVISDLNGSYGSVDYGVEVHETVRWLTHRVRPDLVITTGDMVAGQKAGLDYEAMWRAFHAAVSEPLASAGIPFAPTPGNHDGSGYAVFQGERAHYIAQWSGRRPQVQMVEASHYPLYYAFEHGPALFVSLDATQVGALSAQQMQWLDEVLSRAADKPVKILYGHLPQAPFTQGRESEIIGDPALDALMKRHGVTAIVSGHHHAYYPGKREGVRHIGMACLGASPRRLIGESAASPRAAALLRYSAGGLLSVEAHTGPGLRETIPRAQLPAMIRHGGWTIVRDDL